MSEHHDCCLCRERVGTIKYRMKWYRNDCYELFVASGSFGDEWLDHMGGDGPAQDNQLDGLMEKTCDDVKGALRRDRE